MKSLNQYPQLFSVVLYKFFFEKIIIKIDINVINNLEQSFPKIGKFMNYSNFIFLELHIQKLRTAILMNSVKNKHILKLAVSRIDAFDKFTSIQKNINSELNDENNMHLDILLKLFKYKSSIASKLMDYLPEKDLHTLTNALCISKYILRQPQFARALFHAHQQEDDIVCPFFYFLNSKTNKFRNKGQNCHE